MNLGHISNHKFISERGITLRNRFYYLIKYIEKFFCRLLILFNIYPKTQFYFDSNIKNVSNYNNSFIRKFAKKTSLSNILLNFQIVENINSRSVENYKKKLKKKTWNLIYRWKL